MGAARLWTRQLSRLIEALRGGVAVHETCGTERLPADAARPRRRLTPTACPHCRSHRARDPSGYAARAVRLASPPQSAALDPQVLGDAQPPLSRSEEELDRELLPRESRTQNARVNSSATVSRQHAASRSDCGPANRLCAAFRWCGFVLPSRQSGDAGIAGRSPLPQAARLLRLRIRLEGSVPPPCGQPLWRDGVVMLLSDDLPCETGIVTNAKHDPRRSTQSLNARSAALGERPRDDPGESLR